MKQYTIHKEPYRSKFTELIKHDHLRFEGHVLVGFSNKTVYNFAKATGLRSKKSRVIIKRFRKAFMQMITKACEEYLETKNEEA